MRKIIKKLSPGVQKPIPVRIVEDKIGDYNVTDKNIIMLKHGGYDEWCNEEQLKDWDKREESPELL